MVIDERLDKLTERHESLSHAVELLAIEGRDTGGRIKDMGVKIDGLTTVAMQIVNGTASLLRTAEAREQRISGLEAGLQLLPRPGIQLAFNTIALMSFSNAAQFVLALTLVIPAFSQIPKWTMQDSGTTASLRGIYAVDDKIAWASGTSGTVLKTTDRGAHWSTCTTPPDAQKLDFRGIQAWDASLAIVMSSGPGDQSRIYKTSDGCKTWTQAFKNPDSPDGFFDSFFANWSEETGSPAWTGSILGDPAHGHFILYDTLDSGATWTPRKAPNLPSTEPSLGGFAASNSLFPANQEGTHNGKMFATGGKGGAILWIEKDASSDKLPQGTWQKISLPIAHGTDASGIFSIASRSEKDPFRNVISSTETLIAVGGDYSKPSESAGTAAWSTDSGITWTAATKPPHGYRSSVAWSDKLNAWIAVGTNGSDISSDDGKTWQPFDNEDWNAISLPFVVGPKGRIARLSAK